jgi:hypothetical protein
MVVKTAGTPVRVEGVRSEEIWVPGKTVGAENEKAEVQAQGGKGEAKEESGVTVPGQIEVMRLEVMRILIEQNLNREEMLEENQIWTACVTHSARQRITGAMWGMPLEMLMAISVLPK